MYVSFTTAYLGLGANLGNRLHQLQTARKLLQEAGIVIVQASKVYQTKAWGVAAQPDYLNQVLEITTTLPPEALLNLLLENERKLGRIRHERWAPRTIDIDLLLYGDEHWKSPTLTVPHPLLAVRRFVLTPLAEIAPHSIHPLLHTSMAELLENCTDTTPVEVYRP